MNKISKTLNVVTSTFLLSTTLLGYTFTAYDFNSERNSMNLNEVVDYTSNAANIKLESLPDVINSKQGTVTCSVLNVRQGASTKQKVVTKIKKGDKVTVLETNKSGWAKVKTSNGKTGWVSAKHLKFTTIQSNSNESLPDVKTSKEGTVTCSVLNVRQGASTKQKVVTKIKKGNKVTVLETNKSGWAKVKTSDGKTGWVSAKHLKITTIQTTTKKPSSSASNTTTSNNITVTAKPNSSTSNTSSNVVAVKPDSSTSNTTVNNENKIKDSIINEMLLTEGNVSSTEKSTLKNNLYLLPTNLLTAVKDSGLKILLTTKDVKDYYNYSFSGTMTGLFDPMAGKIYISSNVAHINKSTVHEFGHALDLLIGKNNYASLSNEWVNIYKSESNTASASYYKSNAQEYFADAFDRYIDNPSSLKAKSPKTYAYIHSAIQNL